MFSLLQPFLLRHSGRVLFNAARKAPIIYRTAPSLSSISSRKLVARQYSKEKGNDDNGENHTADSESAGSQEPSDPVPSSSRLSPSSALVLPETKLPTYAPMLAYHRIYMPGTATPFDPYAQMKDGEYIALFLSKKNPIYPITSLLTEQKKKEDAKAKKKTKQAADRDSEPPKVLVEGSQHEIPENIFEVHAVEERPIVEDTTEDISTQSDAKEIDTRHEQKDLDATTNTSANITTTDATSTDTTVTEATATDATSTDTTPTDITTNATATDTISTDATTTTSTTATETTIEVINSTLSDTTEIVPSDTTVTHSTTSATATDTAATETNETYATKVSSTSTETKPASSAATSTSVDKSTQQGDGKDHAGGPSPSTTSTPVGLIAKKQAESGGAVVDSTAVYDVGVLAVVDKQSVANPRLRFLLPVKLCGTARPNLGVSIAPHKSDPFDSQEVEELMGKVKAALTKAMQAFPSTLKVNTSESLMKQKDPNRFVFGLMAEYPSYLAEAQAVLSATSVPYRLAIAQAVVETDMAIRQKQQEINKTLDERTTKEQREFFLREQLKMVRKELGERDEKEELIEKYRARLTGEVPKEAMKVIDDELAKLQMLEPSSSEYSITRNYLDWLTILPWGIYSKDSYDLKHAREVLEADHYGLKDIKERILEFIAVGNLKGSVQGKIICLVGPPGVGKTSIGKSIAGALGRKFYRFSVGGMGDVSEIKGHRRTYVGAMPGKLLQCLKQVKVANPVILIDEIDKLGRGRQGDPASALLEVLDPEQNATFMDHYLDVPVDLSKVLFICTANVKDAIPKPLLDRMEVMYLSGYIPEEQVQIVKKYLVPTAVKSAGLKPGQVEIEDSAVQLLVRAYCREAGVRNLQKHVEKIARKVALKRVRGTRKVSTITETNLSFYVGKPIFSSDRYYQQTPPGIVMGLAWTQLGGAALYVETVQDPLLTRPEMRITGQLGDVMKESTSIAYTYAKNHLDLVDSGNRFFEGASLHMHIPEGATPKDGPSAGITMVTSLLSLALSQPVLQNLAMTGELTLTGKVLPIGGVREKCIASKRAGVTRIILPVGNKKDWTDLPVNIKKGLTVYFADYYKDVYEIAFASPTNIPAPDQTLQYDPKAKSTSSSSPKKSSQKTSISSSNRKSVTSPHKSARLPTSRATAIPSKSYTTILHITKHSSKQLHNMKSAPLLKRAAISKVGQRKKTILKSAPPTKKPPQSPTRKK